MNFFSRDIIFLFSENYSVMENYLRNLLEASSTNKVHYDISSNILAAINVEIPGDVCSNMNSFVFKYEGDQVLPYMDMINTFTKIADFHGLNARFDGGFKTKSSATCPIIQSMIRQFVGYLDCGHNYLIQ